MKSYNIVSRFISFYMMSFSFSETAKKFDVHPNVIRYYVKKFFLQNDIQGHGEEQEERRFTLLN